MLKSRGGQDSEVDPTGETKWTYDGTHSLEEDGQQERPLQEAC